MPSRRKHQIQFATGSLPVSIAILSACTVYDPELLEAANLEGFADGPDDSSVDAGPLDDAEPGEPNISSEVDAQSDETDRDGAGYPDRNRVSDYSNCVPNDDEFCSWICPERCDGWDNDCDGLTDEDFPDVDRDGIAECDDWGSYEEGGVDAAADGGVDAAEDGGADAADDGGADATGCDPIEVCDEEDNDCDGLTDEGCDGEFLYAPSNFDSSDPALDPSTSGDVTLNCGVSVFDASTGSFSNWCDQVQPPAVERTQIDGPPVVIVSFRSLNIATGSTLKLEGDIPVILAVFGNASISGRVDASASSTSPGPGGDDPLTPTDDCPTGAGRGGDVGTDGVVGGGGGGGAAFGGEGSSGGNGGVASDGGNGGMAEGTADLIPLRGGCAGGLGGHGGRPNNDKRWGGAGGGAVQISAAGMLNIAGEIAAAGGGGTKGRAAQDGGGGGGSGGAILLEGDSVVVAASARLSANGGGGASGNSAGNPNGQNGTDGTTSSTTPASGGEGVSGGGNGGDGGAFGGAATAGADGDGNGAGAGGGGGTVGRIRINRSDTCSLLGIHSPAPSVDCV